MFQFFSILLLLFTSNLAWSQTVQENNNTNYSPWSLSAFSLLSAENDQVQSSGSINAYNYIGPNYRINSNERVAVKAAVNANSTGYDRFNGRCVQNADASFDNPFIEYNVYQIPVMPGFVNVFWSGRIYLPVSASSRNKGEIAQYKSNTIFSHWFSRNVFMEYRNDMRFYQQSKKTYFGTHTEDDCSIADNTGPSNTKQYRIDNWINLWYVFNRKWSLGASFKLRDEGYNYSSQDTSRQRNGRMHEITAHLGPSLRYNYSYNVSFILNYQDKVEYSGFHPDRQDDLQELGEFRARNTEISLLSFIRF